MAAKKTTDSKTAAPAKAAPAKGAGDLNAQFEAAVARSKTIKDRPDNDTLLRLYSLFKQGSEGDVKGDKPGMFDFVGAAKYDAWSKLKGTAPDDAKKKYVDLIKKLGG